MDHRAQAIFVPFHCIAATHSAAAAAAAVYGDGCCFLIVPVVAVLVLYFLVLLVRGLVAENEIGLWVRTFKCPHLCTLPLILLFFYTPTLTGCCSLQHICCWYGMGFEQEYKQRIIRCSNAEMQRS